MSTKVVGKKAGGSGVLKKGLPQNHVPYTPSAEELKLMKDCDDILKKITISESRKEAERIKKELPEQCDFLKKDFKFDFSQLPDKIPDDILEFCKKLKAAEGINRTNTGLGEESEGDLNNEEGEKGGGDTMSRHSMGDRNNPKDSLEKLHAYSGSMQSADMEELKRIYDEKIEEATRGNLGSKDPTLKKYNHSTFEKISRALKSYIGPPYSEDVPFHVSDAHETVPSDLADDLMDMYLKDGEGSSGSDDEEVEVDGSRSEAFAAMSEYLGAKEENARAGVRNSDSDHALQKLGSSDDSDGDFTNVKVPEDLIELIESKDKNHYKNIIKTAKQYENYDADDGGLLREKMTYHSVKLSAVPTAKKKTKEGVKGHRIQMKESQPDMLRLRRPQPPRKSSVSQVLSELSSEEMQRSLDIGLSEDILPTHRRQFTRESKSSGAIPKKKTTNLKQSERDLEVPLDMPKILMEGDFEKKHLEAMMKPLNRLAPKKRNFTVPKSNF